MKQPTKIILKSIVVVLAITMLFSCTNDVKKVRNFLADQNLPIGKSKNAFHKFKDSGLISSKLYTPLLLDFSNRKEHPYKKFPKGVKIVNFDKKSNDSVTITGDFALSYTKTKISEIKGNVVVLNHTEKSKLETEQLFWDQKTKYFVTEKPFVLTTEKDTIIGIGLECKEDLNNYLARQTTGRITTENQ